MRFERSDPAADFSMIYAQMCTRAPCANEPWFRQLTAEDLALLFKLYDQRVFEGSLSKALAGQPLEFTASMRLVRSLGNTTRYGAKAPYRYRIGVSALLLFDNFKPGDRTVHANGIVCRDRLSALMRVFEHELVHLAEFLAYGDSNCAAARFQNLCAGLYGHESRFHQLITPRERARQQGIGPGSWVAFEWEGRALVGQVARITRRATVWVRDPQGQRATDGHRYRKYYVDLEALRVARGP